MGHVYIMVLSSRDHRITDSPILTAALYVPSVQHNAARSDDITMPKFSMMHSKFGSLAVADGPQHCSPCSLHPDGRSDRT